MMIDPPIDALAKKTGNNKYKLCVLLGKRAKKLQVTIPEEIQASEKKAISIAADEIMNGDITSSEEE